MITLTTTIQLSLLLYNNGSVCVFVWGREGRLKGGVSFTWSKEKAGKEQQDVRRWERK